MQKRQKIQLSKRSVGLEPEMPNECAKAEKKYHVRWMVFRDLASVLEIERQSFEYSWSEEDFSECLRRRNCVGMVALEGDTVVGFMIYELSKRRIELLNFGVLPPKRRSGIGTLMTRRLIAKLSRDGRTRITFPVRERNLEAQIFFRNLGFRAVCIHHKFYEKTEEDAYMMQYRIPPRTGRPVKIPTVVAK